MASSSSSSSRIQKHDVFLSFRGEDTRDNFISHLQAALDNKQIDAFVDDRLEKGHEISLALVEAIKSSKISVIVFSENFASSTWCLDEAVQILRCKQRNGQLVIPVFYGVDASHVRKQQGSFATAFREHERSFAGTIEKVHKWRKALTTITDLTGWDSSVTKPEADLVAKIVHDVVNKLQSKSFHVGIQKYAAKFESLPLSGFPDVYLVVICGTGGIGKTTIARSVFDRLRGQFGACCFVENVGKHLKRMGYERFKNAVLSNLLNENSSDTRSMFYEARLRNTKVLVVLDDVDDSEQLDYLKQLRLLPGDDDWFGDGSRIIVTTRDEQVLKTRIDDDQIYKVKGLTYNEALQHLQMHAFKKISPTVDGLKITEEAINYCKGALNVSGSVFGDSCSDKEWTKMLEKFICLSEDEDEGSGSHGSPGGGVGRGTARRSSHDSRRDSYDGRGSYDGCGSYHGSPPSYQGSQRDYNDWPQWTNQPQRQHGVGYSNDEVIDQMSVSFGSMGIYSDSSHTGNVIPSASYDPSHYPVAIPVHPVPIPAIVYEEFPIVSPFVGGDQNNYNMHVENYMMNWANNMSWVDYALQQNELGLTFPPMF